MDIEGKMIRGEHALTPIEFIQELFSHVSETYYAVEEACAYFLNSYNEKSGEGNVDFMECSRYISGMIPIEMVDTKKEIAVSFDTYEDPYFLGADGDWHQMENITYSGDDESKYESQMAELQKAINAREQKIAILQKELDALRAEE